MLPLFVIAGRDQVVWLLTYNIFEAEEVCGYGLMGSFRVEMPTEMGGGTKWHRGTSRTTKEAAAVTAASMAAKEAHGHTCIYIDLYFERPILDVAHATTTLPRLYLILHNMLLVSVLD